MGFQRFLFALVCVAIPLQVHAEHWMMLRGQTFSAKFRGLWGDTAIFERADGKRAAIKMTQLNAESRIKIGKLEEDIVLRRNKRISQLKQQVAHQSAREMGLGNFGVVLASESTQLPAAVPYQPMPEDLDLKQTMVHMLSQISSGHVRAYWDSLPVQYQNDLEDLKTALVEKYPADQWNQRVDMVRKLANVLRDKQDLIVGFPMLSRVPANLKQRIQQIVGSAGNTIGPVVDNRYLEHEALSDKSLDELMTGISDNVNQPFRSMLEAFPGSQVPKFDDIEVTYNGDSEGMVITKGQPTGAVWMKVYGKWLPKDIVENWDTWNTTAKASIDSMQITSNPMLAHFDQILSSLAAASEQNSFNNAIARSVVSLGPMGQALGLPVMPRRTATVSSLAGAPGPGGAAHGGPAHGGAAMAGGQPGYDNTAGRGSGGLAGGGVGTTIASLGPNSMTGSGGDPTMMADSADPTMSDSAMDPTMSDPTMAGGGGGDPTMQDPAAMGYGGPGGMQGSGAGGSGGPPAMDPAAMGYGGPGGMQGSGGSGGSGGPPAMDPAAMGYGSSGGMQGSGPPGSGGGQ